MFQFQSSLPMVERGCQAFLYSLWVLQCQILVSLFHLISLPPTEAAEMWFIRRMLRISWTEKKPNVNVLREGNVQRSLLKTIRKRQMEFLGYVCRRRGLEFLSLTGKVEGKRDRGKQRITFLDCLCNSATGRQSKGLNFLKLSDDRDVWRGMAANVCSRSGTWWWWWWPPMRFKAFPLGTMFLLHLLPIVALFLCFYLYASVSNLSVCSSWFPCLTTLTLGQRLVAVCVWLFKIWMKCSQHAITALSHHCTSSASSRSISRH